MFETKMLDFSNVELKFDDEKGTFSGYASKFDGVDSYGDTFVPGAWTKTLENVKTVPMFFNHNRNEVPIGKYTKLEQTDKGLYVEGALTLSISKAREVFEALKAGTVNGLSVGFTARSSDWEMKADGGRVFKNVEALREISVVTYPADSQARITTVKSESIENCTTVRDLETILRDAGLSKSQAVTLVSKARQAFRSESLREAEKAEEQKLFDAFERLNNRL